VREKRKRRKPGKNSAKGREGLPSPLQGQQTKSLNLKSSPIKLHNREEEKKEPRVGKGGKPTSGCQKIEETGG